MEKLFSDYYDFNIHNDYYYKIQDYIPVDHLREQKHKDIIEGAKNYSINTEVLDKSSRRKRGSDIILLVDDEHYICSSRTGMESAGNCVQMSESCPNKLRYSILSNIFENILRRKFEYDISQGVDKSEIFSRKMNISTPKSFVLANKLDQTEIDKYYDDLADLTVDMMTEYYESEDCEDLKNIVSKYNKDKKELFRGYIEFEQTDISQVINNTDSKNGWNMPENVDGGKDFVTIFNKRTDRFMDNITQLFIEISKSSIRIVRCEGTDDHILLSEEFSDKKELKNHLDNYISMDIEDIIY